MKLGDLVTVDVEQLILSQLKDMGKKIDKQSDEIHDLRTDLKVMNVKFKMRSSILGLGSGTIGAAFLAAAKYFVETKQGGKYGR